MQHIPNLCNDAETFLYHIYHSISQVFEEQLLGNKLESTIYRKKRPKIYSFKKKSYLHVCYFSMMSLDNHYLTLSVKKWKSIIVSATDI